MEPSDHPQPAESSAQWPPGWFVREVPETGSTNSDLLDQHFDLPDRSVLRTDHQSAGRGRLDRRWEAPPGSNLLVSLLFRVVPADPGDLMRRVALAAVEAVRAVSGAEAVLKWPNDILLDGDKLAGLLAQRAEDGSVVVGIGLNVGWAPEGAAKLGEGVRLDQLLVALLEAYDGLPVDITSLYRDRLATLGRRVRVELPTGDIFGTATDVEGDGRLVVIDDCALTHRLSIGDVVHLRPA